MKSDMYAMLKREMIVGKYDVVCCIAVEILCSSPNEITHMIGFLIDLVSSHMNKYNMDILKKLVETIEAIHTMPRRTLLIDNEFHWHFCNLMAHVMAIVGPKELVKVCKVDPKSSVDISNDFETMTYNDDIVMRFMHRVKRFQNLIDHQTLRYICVFLWSIRKNKLQLSSFILRKLYHCKEVSCLGLPVQITLNDCINNDVYKQDIVWILWQLIIDEGGICARLLGILYGYKYTRGKRSKRANLMYYALKIAISKRNSDDVVDVNRKMVFEAAGKIGDLIKECLEIKENAKTEQENEEDVVDVEHGEKHNTVSNVSFALPKRKAKKKKKSQKKNKASNAVNEEIPMYLRVLPRRKCPV